MPAKPVKVTGKEAFWLSASFPSYLLESQKRRRE